MLLQGLLRETWPGKHLVALLDARARNQFECLAEGLDAHWCEPSIAGRWRAEKLLAHLSDRATLILCFHNLPPIMSVKGSVYCYVQNANLVGLVPVSVHSGWVRIRYFVERAIAKLFKKRVSRYIVQTPTMASALIDWYGPQPPPVEVMPFSSPAEQMHRGDIAQLRAVDSSSSSGWDFIYVSDGSTHKNHARLFSAWEMLAEDGIYPTLAVTLHPERDGQLREAVRSLSLRGVKIEDLGQLPRNTVIRAYSASRALIFPSYAESFGLPLIEASAAGVPILAPELDYVRDVCDPDVTFDAMSPRSIARAVRRFLGRPMDRAPLLSPQVFVQNFCALAATENS